MVYAHDSKSCLARDEGSSPSSGTKSKCANFLLVHFVLLEARYERGTRKPDPELVEGEAGSCKFSVENYA